MRIYFSMPDELMLLDSLDGMNALHARLEDFLASFRSEIRLEAEQWGTSDPHDELLAGLEIKKAEGPVMLSLGEDKWLSLTGSVDNLRRYISHFRFERDDDHHHPEHVPIDDYMSRISMSMSLDVCTDWIQELRASRH